MIPRNVGVLDRILRTSAGIVFLPGGIVLLGALGGNPLGVAVSVLGLIALCTGLMGRSAVYALIDIERPRSACGRARVL